MSMMAEFDAAARNLPEAFARTLRHEVGDLLQTIYAAVAILQRRLAADATLEQRVLADLRNRAEACKRLLDNMSDLVTPVNLTFEQVDLAQVADSLVTVAARRYPNREIRSTAMSPVCVPADEKRIAQIGEILLNQACEAAQRCVSLHARPNPTSEETEWIIADDRAEDSPEPFEETAPLFERLMQDGNRGIDRTLAQRLVLLHGGRITTEHPPEGGLAVHVWLPNQRPESES